MRPTTSRIPQIQGNPRLEFKPPQQLYESLFSSMKATGLPGH
jgi:hypothetical protein